MSTNTALEILKKELAAGVIRRLYLFYGPESFLTKHYARQIEKIAVAEAARPYCVSVFDGNAKVSDVAQACASYPLIGDRNLVVVKNAGLVAGAAQAKNGKKRSGAAQAASAAQAAGAKRPGKDGAKSKKVADLSGSGGGETSKSGDLCGLFESVPEFTCLLIIEDNADKRTKVFAEAKKNGLAVEFPYQKPEDLARWASMVCARYGVVLSGSALRYFIGRSDESMTQMRSELEKLTLYAEALRDRPERRARITRNGMTAVDERDIESVCSFPARARIFDLMDRVAARDVSGAIAALRSLSAAGEPTQKIMSMLTRHIVLLRQTKVLRERGARPDATATALALNPYRAGVIWRQCANFSLDALERAISAAHRCDAAAKKGAMDDGLALESIIAMLSTGTDAAALVK